MKIILLKEVPKVGKKYDVKEIADGHALNFIIPRGLGIPATPANSKKVEVMKRSTNAERSVKESLLAQNIEAFKVMTLTIRSKANEKGHLFAGLHAEEIAQALEKEGRVSIDPSFIKLDKPIKEIGQYIMTIEALGKSVGLKVLVEAE